MKRQIARAIALLWLVGAVYYGSGAVWAILEGQGSITTDVATRLVASLWVGLGAILMLARRGEGWWAAIAFLLICLGGHLNRTMSHPLAGGPVGLLEPLAWAAVHLSLLTWLRRELGYQSPSQDTQWPSRA
jgi:hypothetical protein